MKGYIKIKYLYIFGAPVHIHWSALVVIGGLLGLSINNPFLAIISMCSYFGIILLHETGHAVFARIYDCRIKNIYLGFMHGLCEYESSHVKKHNLIISWGGVVAQFVVAVPLIFLAQQTNISDLYGMGPIIVFLGYISFIMALINLSPSKGLDGWYAWKLIPLLIRKMPEDDGDKLNTKNSKYQKSPEKIVDDLITKMKNK